ncbi:MmgE/PrpD family protein [Novosphingobium guangzhouense]|uniref:2-methylcitrate dehydratase n=1 Tax=Novosphingobium guangzhouense TaxID=1850347 RepID=A0A2K2FTV6_9SPHN|nr:MmgE/PrpD family protein [Novosphingobium guangzhouense]PNU02212.1 2-methylcitrate dehydratase [Novosphingobium guangzhouense]
MIARNYADFASRLTLDAVPERVRERACHLMLDSIGTGIAALGETWEQRAFAAAQDLGKGRSAVLGHGRSLAPREAALVNGLLMHGLDYDDTHSRGIIHATVSSLPAALAAADHAAADHAGASGADLLRAYIVAMEVSTRVATVAAGGFHRHGFHPTSLCGAFGATVGAGLLMGLDAQQIGMAQGIVLSMTGGSLEFLEDGAWTKRLHPGWAASSALTAATMAKHGFVGPKAAYEGRFGLYSLYLRDGAPAGLADACTGLGENWEIESVSVKPLPACHMTHASGDAAAAICAEHGLAAGDIARVTVLVPEAVIPIVCEPAAPKKVPATSYDAQFSIPYVVATGLLRGRFTLDELDGAALADPEVLRLAQKVEYAADPDTDYPVHFTGEVIVETTGGRRITKREAVNRGAADRPLSNAEIRAKYHDNAARCVTAAQADAIADAVLDIANHPAARLSDLLAAAAPVEILEGTPA